MNVTKAQELFRQLMKTYFPTTTVIFSRQSRVAKPEIPLITLTPGMVHRHQHPVWETVCGEPVGYFTMRLPITIDLFTNGQPVVDEETGLTVAMENTAVNDAVALEDFLCSQYVIDWCDSNDMSIEIAGDAQDLTGLVNDNNYEFRSRIEVVVYFTHTMIGHASVLDEESLVWNPDDPADCIIDPEFRPTSTGGGSDELARLRFGYFTEAHVEEEQNE